MNSRLLTCILSAMLWAPALLAGDGAYIVTLDLGRAVDATRASIEALAASYGGSVESADPVRSDVYVMRLPAARARSLAADPRVASVAPLAAAAQATGPQEVVSWTSGVAYSYDGSGNIRQIGKDTFVYDHSNRLIQAEVNGTRREYEYDAYGNRQKCTQGAGTAVQSDCQGYAIDRDDNHIIGAVYDPAGSGAVSTLGLHSYSWDEFQMLRRDQSAEPREFVYTAGDERIATYFPNSRSWNWTVRDESNKILREFASSGGAHGTASFTWKKDYVYRDKLLLASVQPEGGAVTRYHYHLDHLGSARRITDSNDNLVGFRDFFAFGPQVNGGKDEPSRTALRYTGHERDAAFDPLGVLDYMHARYYNPELGRFLSLDPKPGKIKTPQSWNRYSYTMNNPLRAFDPDGRQTMDYRILHVRVNIVYGNVDNKGFMMRGTLRERTERGTQLARNLFGHIGISISIHRYEGVGLKYDNQTGQLSGAVRTESGEVGVGDFVKQNYGKAVTAFASSDFVIPSARGGTGFLKGIPTATILPRNANDGTLAHELAHALGNRLSSSDTPVFGENFLTDRLWDLEVLQYDMGIGFSMEFEEWLRNGAEQVGCDYGHDC